MYCLIILQIIIDYCIANYCIKILNKQPLYFLRSMVYLYCKENKGRCIMLLIQKLVEKKIDKLHHRIDKTAQGGAWYRRTRKGIIIIIKMVYNGNKPIKSSYQLLAEMENKYNVRAKLF